MKFKKKYKHNITIISCVIILLIYSILINYISSNQNKNIILRKIIQVITSVVMMIIISNINPVIYKKKAYILYTFSNILLITVLISGYVSKGAQRWLNIGGFFKFQPSELIKIVLPILISKIISENKFPLENKKLILSLILIFIPTILVAIQPDLGTAILIFMSGLITLFLGGIEIKKIILLMFLLTLLTPFIWKYFLHNYQKERILTLFKKSNNIIKTQYHSIQSKIAIGSGGICGKGMFNGTQSKFNFIPEKVTDFVFAVIAEENGFYGILILILVYFILITKIFIIIFKIKDNFDKLLSSSLISIFFIYIFTNIAMVSGLFPIVGIPLPLISYGGSSTICITSIFGIILSIERKTQTT